MNKDKSKKQLCILFYILYFSPNFWLFYTGCGNQNFPPDVKKNYIYIDSFITTEPRGREDSIYIRFRDTVNTETLKVFGRWKMEQDTGLCKIYFIGYDKNYKQRFGSETTYYKNLTGREVDYKLTWVADTSTKIKSDTGYKLVAYLKQVNANPESIWADTSGPLTILHSTDSFSLLKWCGDMRYGNPNETLFSPIAYPIFC